MRYTYKFVNGESISVEVSEEMLAVLQDEDRIESNNEQTNSKSPGRFVRLDAPGGLPGACLGMPYLCGGPGK